MARDSRGRYTARRRPTRARLGVPADPTAPEVNGIRSAGPVTLGAAPRRERSAPAEAEAEPTSSKPSKR